MLATEGDPRIPEPLDVIFICDTLHLIEGPERYLRELHGHVRTDDYFWLNERDNPDVIAYLEAEPDLNDTNNP